MDTEKWKMLIESIDRGSLAAAAEALGYTVSGISKSVAALEKELGFELLYRSKSGVVPTRECEKLMPQVRELLFVQKNIEQMSAQIRGADSGDIVIGTAYSHYYGWLTRATSAFHEKHPGVQFHIISGYSSQLAQMLVEHRLDFAIISRREGDFEWMKLCQDPVVAMIPKGHRLSGRKSVPIGIFAEEPFVDILPGHDTDHMHVLGRCGVKPDVKYTTMDVTAAYAIVGAGLALCMTNSINIMDNYREVVHIPVKPAQTIEIGVAFARQLPPAAKEFIQFLDEYNSLHN